MQDISKIIFTALGGLFGWFVGEFEPTFPLIVIAIVFILYDAYSAYRLDGRVRRVYPTKVAREKARFTSFAFGKVVKSTIPNRLVVILLAYLVEHWVFNHIVSIPLSYIVTGVICFEQAWSILENQSSCRPDSDSKLWRALQKILIDKSARHFEVDLSEITGVNPKEKKDGDTTTTDV